MLSPSATTLSLSAPLSFLSSRAYPDFLLHRSRRRPGCGALQREPHAADRSRNSRQEIRGRRGICSSTDLSWKCFPRFDAASLNFLESPPSPFVILRACDFFAPTSSLHIQSARLQANKVVILSEAPRRSIANQRVSWRGVEGPRRCLLANTLQ